MVGDDGSGGHTPKDFNECVSQEQLDDAKRDRDARGRHQGSHRGDHRPQAW